MSAWLGKQQNSFDSRWQRSFGCLVGTAESSFVCSRRCYDVVSGLVRDSPLFVEIFLLRVQSCPVMFVSKTFVSCPWLQAFTGSQAQCRHPRLRAPELCAEDYLCSDKACSWLRPCWAQFTGLSSLCEFGGYAHHCLDHMRDPFRLAHSRRHTTGIALETESRQVKQESQR